MLIILILKCVFTDIDGREVRTGRQGGDGGEARIFTLENNERITRVEGRAQRLIDRLQFFTNKGRTCLPVIIPVEVY